MFEKTIKEIKVILNSENVEEDVLQKLETDTRAGVERLLKSYHQKIEKKQVKLSQFEQKKSFDASFRSDRNVVVAGFDEAGRGPLAGPVVAACVIFPSDIEYIEIDDSKRVSEHNRTLMEEQVKQHALAYAVCEASVEEIDKYNILEATKLAMKRCAEQLSIKPELLLLDAITIDYATKQESIVKGDQKSLCIGAASILAKQHRDRLMREIHQQYPQYGFDKHVGYGTKKHLESLEQFGAIPGIHRVSFSPVSKYM